ncbi:MAG: hypothetical protein NT111_01240, partial [Patescibacteria group bacterium]|nr:hypothetical protein [Patescibacteria group bacterium]
FDYRVELSSTNCHFGGKRWWLICPLAVDGKLCNRRVRIIYKSGSYFGCRACHNLCYSVQNENHHYYNNKIFKILESEMKAEELLEKIRFQYYNGKPTRKMKRYIELRRRSIDSYRAWEEIDDLLKR